jgi:hypothetical protein
MHASIHSSIVKGAYLQRLSVRCKRGGGHAAAVRHRMLHHTG